MCKIVIDVEGGLIHQIYCSDREAEVTVVDWDAGGDSEPETVQVLLPEGRQFAHVLRWLPEPWEGLSGTACEAALEAADYLHEFSRRHRATMHAALRAWQSALSRDGANLLRAYPQLDEHPPLVAEEIDALCERLQEPFVV